jgi:hypothetical protein
MHSEVRMMNRLQLSPQSGTHDALPLSEWVAYNELAYDERVRPGLELPQVNWYAALGLTVAIIVSAGVWAGIGLIVEHFW